MYMYIIYALEETTDDRDRHGRLSTERGESLYKIYLGKLSG